MSRQVELSFDGFRLCLEMPGSYALPVMPPERIDALLEAAFRALGKGAASWVSGENSLLENLAVWENILLPTQWHVPASEAALAARLREWLVRLGFDDQEMLALFAQRPSGLHEVHRRLVLWLRVLLLRPRLVVLDADLWPDRRRDGVLADLVLEELGNGCLLAVGDTVPAGFQPVHLDADEESLP